ncbi:cation:proton antiporter [Granulosicoccus antarcticus]|uniref:Glutathione-regulated potassium-efflux system protein KefC n=1 Tax=Granulosicoccus antarcticus IMCC3135 TaxID=1192854 RepID=A0A2Z2P453_9GAMM|nr:cation:proton antiporter [Granulosicoccus antarcticus]ASJ75447.1 Glutathione-regulated potassium-efflux system protein KefC [Granulosicoccus antarcticus IMCC3135]
MGETNSLLLNIFIYLLAGLLAVPSAKRLGLGPVFGYLFAGILIGPWGLALIRDVQHIDLFSRVATVLLLFLVALQATPARVNRLLNGAIWLGTLQFCLTALVITLVGMLIGHPWHHALVAGLALAISSEAVASHCFNERYPTGSPLTEAGYQLLLTQSMAIVPVFVLLPLLGFGAAITQGSPWPRVIMGLLFLGGFGIFGHLMLRHAFRYVVSIGLDEVFAAFALLLTIGLLLVVRALDLPLELAALLGGLLLIRSEYGSAIRIAMRPFTGLLVGMFFISTGMQIDFAIFIRKPLETFALVALLVFVKAWIVRNILRYSKVPRQQRIWLATVLAQSGELAFVVIALAITYKAIPDKLAAQLVLVVALSMLTTPILLFFAARRDTLPARQQSDTGVVVGEIADSQVIVAGYGRVGCVVAMMLKENGFRAVVIDHSPDRFTALRAAGFVGFYGDATRPDLLDAAGAARAAALVIALDDPEAASDLLKRVRREYPHLTVLARAIGISDEHQLLRDGADRTYGETFETALLIGEDVLELVGLSPLDAQAMAERFRDAALDSQPTATEPRN